MSNQVQVFKIPLPDLNALRERHETLLQTKPRSAAEATQLFRAEERDFIMPTLQAIATLICDNLDALIESGEINLTCESGDNKELTVNIKGTEDRTIEEFNPETNTNETITIFDYNTRIDGKGFTLESSIVGKLAARALANNQPNDFYDFEFRQGDSSYIKEIKPNAARDSGTPYFYFSLDDDETGARLELDL